MDDTAAKIRSSICPRLEHRQIPLFHIDHIYWSWDDHVQPFLPQMSSECDGTGSASDRMMIAELRAARWKDRVATAIPSPRAPDMDRDIDVDPMVFHAVVNGVRRPIRAILLESPIRRQKSSGDRPGQPRACRHFRWPLRLICPAPFPLVPTNIGRRESHTWRMATRAVVSSRGTIRIDGSETPRCQPTARQAR